MSVRLNEAALHALLDSEVGPVGREVSRKAEELAAEAQRGVDTIMAGAFVRPTVGTQRVGEGVLVGLRDEGRAARYLDQKARREAGTVGDWMRNALRQVFPFG